MVTVQQEIGKLNLSKASYEIVSFLVTTMDELEFFKGLFWSDMGEFFAVSEYREHRIKKRNLTWEEFSGILLNNKRQALEELFQHRITNTDLHLFDTGDVSAEYIFNEHKNNIRLTFARLVL
jgi:hypothetical protein